MTVIIVHTCGRIAQPQPVDDWLGALDPAQLHATYGGKYDRDPAVSPRNQERGYDETSYDRRARQRLDRHRR